MVVAIVAVFSLVGLAAWSLPVALVLLVLTEVYWRQRE
jgi:hypothetical protein